MYSPKLAPRGPVAQETEILISNGDRIVIKELAIKTVMAMVVLAMLVLAIGLHLVVVGGGEGGVETVIWGTGGV